MSKPWDGIISENEQKAYNAAGFGRPTGLGKRPALLIIDVQYRTVGTVSRPFWEAIKEFPTACGDVGWSAVKQIERLLAMFRNNDWPVMYPYVSPKQSFDQGRLSDKIPAIMNISQKATSLLPRSHRAKATSCCRRSIPVRFSVRRWRVTDQRRRRQHRGHRMHHERMRAGQRRRRLRL